MNVNGDGVPTHLGPGAYRSSLEVILVQVEELELGLISRHQYRH